MASSIDEWVRDKIRDLVYPALPTQAAVEKTTAEVRAAFEPWLKVAISDASPLIRSNQQ